MRVHNKLVLLTVSMVVLAGLLSAGATFWHTRNLSSSYDNALRVELEQKGLAYSVTATAFLDVLGLEGPDVLQAILASVPGESTPADEAGSLEAARRSLQSIELWLPDPAAPGGYRLVDRQDFDDTDAPANSPEVVQGLLDETIATQDAAAAIDEEAQLILSSTLIPVDETPAVAVAALSAEEEFAFFAAERGEAVRNGIIVSIAIVGFVSAVGTGLSYVVARDLTERARVEATLRDQVRRDPLTGVLNHAAIVEELRGLLAEGQSSHAIAMADVDGLKATNDTFGHQVGDTVLVTVARALTREGVVLGRYGGDEFVAVIIGADRAAAERYRDAVLADLDRGNLIDPETGAGVPVVATLGLAVYPEEAGTMADLIGLSDNAMYAAKRQRPAGGLSRTRPLGDHRAAEMVGQIVPLLTSPGELKEKLRLVAHRLSIGADYDAVDFVLFSTEPGPTLVSNTYARLPQELLDAWSQEYQREGAERHPMRALLERTQRPIIVNDVRDDERLLEPQRAILQAADLRSALVVPMSWHDQVVGALSVASKRGHAFTPRDAQFLTAVATEVAAIMRMATLLEELQSTSERLAQAQEETVLLLAAAAEAHDRTTGYHLQGVRALTEALARELGYSAEDAHELGLAAVLHDIGKIRVTDAVLARSGRLTDEEWELMKRHTVWGAEFLAGRPRFQPAATIARSHHEHWDGSGYPDGLSGEAIPEAAAIVAVSDSFDAITTDRPYRTARPPNEALQEIAANAGTQFSPRVVAALVRLAERGALPEEPMRARDRRAAA